MQDKAEEETPQEESPLISSEEEANKEPEDTAVMEVEVVQDNDVPTIDVTVRNLKEI